LWRENIVYRSGRSRLDSSYQNRAQSGGGAKLLVLSPSLVILSEAKNLASDAQGKLREGPHLGGR